MEEFAEFEAATSENVDIRLEVKDKLLALKVIVPRVEFLAIACTHTVGIMVHGI